jgi:hypothetical protein
MEKAPWSEKRSLLVRQKYITVMDFKNSEKNNPGR